MIISLITSKTVSHSNHKNSINIIHHQNRLKLFLCVSSIFKSKMTRVERCNTKWHTIGKAEIINFRVPFICLFRSFLLALSSHTAMLCLFYASQPITLAPQMLCIYILYFSSILLYFYFISYKCAATWCTEITFNLT